MKREFDILKYYLKEHFLIVILYLGEALLFLFLAGLYGYGKYVVNMMYALQLCLVIGLAAGIRKYIRYRRKILDLAGALEKEEEYASALPEAGNLAEEILGKIIEREEKEKKKLVSELDEKKQDMSDYYTMWIHQIKTPIAAMKLLLQKETQEEGRQVEEELFKIEQYAKMALHYARLDSMSSDMLLKEYDICDIIKQAVKNYYILLTGRQMSFQFEEFKLTAVTDEKWLLFVIEQLLSNAIKYTPAGEIRIYGVNSEGRKDCENVSHIVIEDTGIGIEKEDLPRIFERGFTGYNGRMDKKSTGIGLYLCRQIMGKLSHSIRVDSVRGKGTAVTVGFEQIRRGQDAM